MICCVKMYFIFIYFNILVIYVSVNADVITWDNNLPWSYSKNVYNVNYEDDECVNFNSTRTQNRNSIDTKNACITLYAKRDCQGESANFKSNKTFFPFLDRVNFEGRAVSFKKCDNVDHKLLKTRERPRHHLILHAESRSDKNTSSLFSVRSGECMILPQEWRSQFTEFFTLFESAMQLFVYDNCTEMETQIRRNPLPGRTNTAYEVFDEVIKSVRVLDSEILTGHQTCANFLFFGSEEYIFWTYLFSKYGDTYMETFQALVNRSTDGFISWDFIFTPSTSTRTSIPDIDALQSHIILFGGSRLSELSQLGLTEDYIQTLGHLAYDVYLERSDQSNFEAGTNWCIYYKRLWIQMYTSLLSSPKLEFVGRSNYAVEVYGGSAIRNFTLENGECKLLSAEWRGRIEKVLQGSHCFALFKTYNCTGPRHWAIPLASFGFEKIRELPSRNDRAMRSIKVCDLTFAENCTTCPKLFYQGSEEYEFWLSFISIYAKDSLEKFKNRANSPINGSILWDFLGGSNATNRSLSDQYRFAFDTLYNVTRSLQTGRIGRLGFNTSNLENLRTLAARVLAERRMQGAKMDAGWAIDDIVAMSQLSSIWLSVENMLNQTLTKWYLGAAADDDGFNNTGSADVNLMIKTKTEIISAKPTTDSAKSVINSAEPTKTSETARMKVTVMKGAAMMTLAQEINERRDLNGSAQASTCGIVGVNKATHLQQTTPLISSGRLAKYGDDPWHAALYRRLSATTDPIYICGATLISQTVLVTAAHCFYDEALGRAFNDTSEYEIILGKFASDYSAPPDSTSQSKHKIKKLIFYPQGYDPVGTDTYGSDILLIILETVVKFDSHILPVCLDWDQSIFTSPAFNGTTGRLAGWGQLSDKTVSSYLMTADLPYISFNECKGKVSHLPTDKFCAGSKKGPGARIGDSGGGLVFKHEGRYYLRGIVSTGDRISENSIATFTDLTRYLPWIQKHI